MNKLSSLGTVIHGCGASSAIDTAGEKMVISGIDDSVLATTGVINFEHNNASASSVVGKILESKKILKLEDCENKHHLKFFQLCGEKPYLYIRAVLLDNFKHSGAIDLAAMFRFDEASNLPAGQQLVKFSIEGARLITKPDGTVEKCIARKISCTVTPCNHNCYAEILDESQDEVLPQSETDKLKALLSSVFKKSEEEYAILSKNDEKVRSPATKQIIAARKEKGLQSQDKYVKEIGSAKMAQHNSPRPEERTTASSSKAPKPSSDNMKVISGQSFRDKIEEKRKNKSTTEVGVSTKTPNYKQKPGIPGEVSSLPKTTNIKSKFPNKVAKTNNMRSTLIKNFKSGNQALAVESLDKKMYKSISDEIYNRFDKKEELLSVISNKYPEMSKSEILAIAKTTTFAMEKKLENELESLTKNVGQLEFHSLPKMRTRPESDVKTIHSPIAGLVAAHSASNKTASNTGTKLSNKTTKQNEEALASPEDEGMSFRSHNKQGVAGSPTNIAHLGSNEGVAHHEGLHGTFSNLSHKHGLNQEQMSSVHNHFLNMIHPHDINAIKAHMASNGYDENSPTHHEEVLAHVHQALEGGKMSDSKMAQHKQEKRAGNITENKPSKFGNADFNKTRLRDSWNLIRHQAKTMDEGKLHQVANSNIQPDYKNYKKSDDEPENLPVLSKPFKSQQQKKFMYANPDILGEEGLKEWQSKTDESKLPKKKKKE